MPRHGKSNERCGQTYESEPRFKQDNISEDKRAAYDNRIRYRNPHADAWADGGQGRPGRRLSAILAEAAREEQKQDGETTATTATGRNPAHM